jgi:hypothetical protein
MLKTWTKNLDPDPKSAKSLDLDPDSAKPGAGSEFRESDFEIKYTYIPHQNASPNPQPWFPVLIYSINSMSTFTLSSGSLL